MYRALVAQWLEHWSYEPGVTGSNPVLSRMRSPSSGACTRFVFSTGLIFIVEKRRVVIRRNVFEKFIPIDNCRQIVAYKSYISLDHKIYCEIVFIGKHVMFLVSLLSSRCYFYITQ